MSPDPTVWAVAFTGAAVVTGIVVRLARKAGALDAPDPARRIHSVPTPRFGGVGIAFGVLAGLLVAHLRVQGETDPSRLFGPSGAPNAWVPGWEPLRPFGPAQTPILWGAILFFAVGFVDDVRRRGGIPTWVKWLAQLGAAIVPVVLGVRWTGDFAGPWPDLRMGEAEPVMTVLWILAVVNVVNFMDGIDLLVAVTSIVAFGAFVVEGRPSGAALYGAAAAATVGFGLWNMPLPRARAFMGDGGSHLLGFLIAMAACGVEAPWVSASDDPYDWRMSSGTQAIPTVPWPLVGALLLPAILDVLEALVHKARHGIRMSQAHADHLYQRLVKAGWPAWAVALRYGLLSLAGVLLAGPVAERWGLVAAIVPGVALLVVHWVTGVRATRNVPRLART